MPSSRLDASDVTAIAATVAALAAVAVSVWDNVQQREFYRVSVIPQLDYQQHKEGSESGGVTLTNEGTGPAEVDTLRIGFCGSGRTPTFESWNEARAAVEALELTLVGYHDLRSGELVGSGQTVEWVRVEAADPDAGGDPVQRFIDTVAFRIEYVSIYDEPFRVERRPDCLAGGGPETEA